MIQQFNNVHRTQSHGMVDNDHEYFHGNTYAYALRIGQLSHKRAHERLNHFVSLASESTESNAGLKFGEELSETGYFAIVRVVEASLI